MIKNIGEKEITLKETTKEGIEVGKEIKCLVKVVLDEEQQPGDTKIILQNSEDEKSLELTIGISFPAEMFEDNLVRDLVTKISDFLKEKAIGSIEEEDQFTALTGSGNTSGELLRYSNNLFEITTAVSHIIGNAE